MEQINDHMTAKILDEIWQCVTEALKTASIQPDPTQSDEEYASERITALEKKVQESAIAIRDMFMRLRKEGLI
jgi:hypothetical protein